MVEYGWSKKIATEYIIEEFSYNEPAVWNTPTPQWIVPYDSIQSGFLGSNPGGQQGDNMTRKRRKRPMSVITCQTLDLALAKVCPDD